MSHSTNACRALLFLGSFAAVSGLPVAASAQCTSSFELFAAAAPRNLSFAFHEPTTGRVIASELPYVGATTSDTWSWDGASWQRIAGGGPINVIPAMVTWDSARNRGIVVAQSGETWEWDGSSWSHPANCSSTRCAGAAITYDAARSVTLMVTGGGVPNSPPAETWEWNGSSWTQRAVSGPGNRKLHTLTYDPVRNVSVLLGGQIDPAGLGPPTWLSDLWEFNGSSWTQRTFSGGPGTVSEQGAVYHAASGGVVIYGGRNIGLKTQMMSWNGASWTNINALTPGAQQDASLMSDPAGSRLMMLGRIIPGDDQFAQHRWQLYSKPDAGAWSSLSRADDYTPSTGYQSAACFDSDRGVTVVFGGLQQNGLRDNTTWEYDGAAWHKSPATGPGPRSMTAMAYDPVRHRVVLVGGYDGTSTRPAETWEYDGATWTLASTSAVGARNGHSMTFDPVLGKVVMHGGRGAGDVNRIDTQAWDGTSWTQIATGAPSHSAFIAFDQGAQAVVGAFLSNGTRRLDAGVWTLLSATNFRYPLAWDASYGRLVAYRGTGGDGVHSWNGSSWQPEVVGAFRPGSRDEYSVVYDPRRDRMLIWGGWVVGYRTNEMWEWVRPTADMGRQGGLPGPDGVLDNNDFVIFIDRFFASDLRADVGKQGGVFGSDRAFDNNDFVVFIDLYFNGCGI